MNEVMNEGASPAGSAPGQAPLSGGKASDGGMAPQRPNSMASLRDRWSRNLQPQGNLPRGSRAKMLGKKAKKKEDLDPKARMRMLKKRAAIRTLRK